MHSIIEKTYELIDVLDNSDVIKNIDKYKNNIINNKELVNLISEGNKCDDNYKLLDIKNRLYKYKDYKEYMSNYNRLMYIVMDINSRYKKIINERRCIK